MTIDFIHMKSCDCINLYRQACSIFLGEMQRIAFAYCYRRLCLCVCVCVSVCLFVTVCMPRLWTSGKRFEIETFFLNCAEHRT